MPKQRPKTQDEILRNLKVIYDNFDIKDLTWDEFKVEMLQLFDPKLAMDDLGDIQLIKARERSNRIRINRALN